MEDSNNPIPLLKRLERAEAKAPSPPEQVKPIKIPRKAKVRKGKLKKGWIGILRIDENGNLTGEKQKVEDSTIRLKDGDYHTMDGEEILFWEGKFPVIIQRTWKLNPEKLRIRKDEKNETYGQKYIMARMLGDTIKVKAKSGSIIVWALVIGAILFGINYFGGA